MILNYKNKTIFVTLILFALFINNLSTDQHSSRGIKPHIMMFTVLDSLRKIVPTCKRCNQQYQEGTQLRNYQSRTELLYFVQTMVSVN